MATDQFGNILSPEEEERLRQHQMRMGVMPAALPPTAPFGGGIGLSNYKGKYGPYEAPAPWSPEPIVPNEPFSMGQLASSITPTWDTGSVSNVSQFAGPTVNKFTPTGSDYTPQQLGTPIDELQQQNIPDNVVPLDLAFGAFGAQHVPALPVNPSGTMNFQDFLDKVGPVQSGTRDAYYMPDGTVRNAAGDLVSTDTTFDPTAGLAATDPNLQGVTPFSQASVAPQWDTSAVSAVAPFTGTDPVFTGDELDVAAQGTAPIKDLINALPIAPGYGTKTPWGEIIGGTLGAKSSIGATDLPVTWALPIAAAIAIANTGDDKGADPDYGDTGMGDTGLGHPGMGDAPGYDMSGLQMIDTTNPGVPSVNISTGVGPIIDNPGPTKDEVDAIIEKAISAPTGNLERIAAAKAAAKGKRASDLARQKKAAADKRAADRAAAQAQAASAAQAKAAQKAAKAVLARMNNDRNTPSSREIAAAIEVMSQVDSFGSGGMRNSRGEVGMDETGYTDSSGLGVG
jgi:hypothetical protein